jgi:acetyltransferase-like isoleucine patch superfamily enzyme
MYDGAPQRGGTKALALVVMSERWRVNAEFGRLFHLRGVVRRRAGLTWTRFRHQRLTFGRRCDVRPTSTFLVARNATARFGVECVLDRGMTIECRGKLEVGDRTVFGHHCTIAVAELVQIGNDCLIAEMVSIRDHDHEFDSTDIPLNEQGQRCSPVRIGDNVWLGSKVTVTHGVTIGSNTIVGANAVVTGDLPPDSIAVGIPARVLRRRDAAT